MVSSISIQEFTFVGFGGNWVVYGVVFTRSLPLIGRDQIFNSNWNCMGEFGALVGFASLDSWHSIQHVQR